MNTQGGARQLWRKLTGQDKQDAQDLTYKRKSLENLEWRKAESKPYRSGNARHRKGGSS